MCYSVNQCLGLFCYHPAALENNNNPVFCLLFFCISCLLYQHLPLGRFSCVLGSEAVHFRHGGESRRIPVRQPTPSQPAMAHISGREVRFLPANCSPVCAVDYKPTRLKWLQIYSSGFSNPNTSLKQTLHQGLHFTQNCVKVSV